MRFVIEKAQKDWDRVQKMITDEKSKIIEKINLDEIRQEFEARAKNLEEQVGEAVKNLEPTCQMVLDGLRKNAEKVGIDVEKVEGALRDGVATARQTLGIVGDLSVSPSKSKKAQKKTTRVAKKVTKKAVKKAPSTTKKATKKKVAKKTSTTKPVASAEMKTKTVKSAATATTTTSSLQPK